MFKFAESNINAELIKEGHILTTKTINKGLLSAEYAVRGEIALRAEQLREHIERKEKPDLPFDQIINCNIGNPQQLGQFPISFYRKVMSLLENSVDLLDSKNRQLVSTLYPEDAIRRAEKMLQAGGNIGPYSHSQGLGFIRKDVANFIARRDGYPSNPDNIFLTSGASQGVQMILQTIISTPTVGIMIPIPQYPLYTASLSLNGGLAVPYYLEERSGWRLEVKELERAINEARSNGTDVKALCVINPGNPTGNCLSVENMRDIIKFCSRERLVLLADEVYQENIYTSTKKFHSFKKIVMEMGGNEKNFEMVSFHSVSKGFLGECGRRGGYFELFGFDKDVFSQIYKLASICLCPTLSGQLMIDLMVNPPAEGDESFELYKKEVEDIINSLKRRATRMVSAFNTWENVSCEDAEGAMYLFPKIVLPTAAVDAAKAAKKSPDEFYCMKLLEATGVCAVPGSGFGQKEGTFHFRCTFLPPEHLFDSFIDKMSKFHSEFMEEYNK